MSTQDPTQTTVCIPASVDTVPREETAQRIVVAMSGGVDSSVAAARLVEQGHDVIGLTLHLWDVDDPTVQGSCSTPEGVRDARRVADQLGIPHHCLDHREQFVKEIVDPFVNEYLAARTPCPCATCNERIKIPFLVHFARAMGATAAATGHYAKLVQTGAGVRVARGFDCRKDQSYFLSTVDVSSLRMLRFPLGQDTKETIREEAIRRGLAVAKKRESQDLCFVPDGSYVQFVENRAKDRVQPGWIVDESGKKLGEHAGVHRFTLGQRKGLGISAGKVMFVSKIDAEKRLVVLEDAATERVTGIVVSEPVIAEGVEFPLRVVLQVRYRDDGMFATLEKRSDGSVCAMFDNPIRTASPGQLAVGYVGDEVHACPIQQPRVNNESV